MNRRAFVSGVAAGAVASAAQIDAGDPMPIAERFSVAGEIAVIDLDAAMRRGSNAGLVESLVARFPSKTA